MNIRLIALITALIGAINWGLVGICNCDLVAYLFTDLPTLQRAIYIIIAAAGIYSLYAHIAPFFILEEKVRYRK